MIWPHYSHSDIKTKNSGAWYLIQWIKCLPFMQLTLVLYLHLIWFHQPNLEWSLNIESGIILSIARCDSPNKTIKTTTTITNHCSCVAIFRKYKCDSLCLWNHFEFFLKKLKRLYVKKNYMCWTLEWSYIFVYIHTYIHFMGP